MLLAATANIGNLGSSLNSVMYANMALNIIL